MVAVEKPHLGFATYLFSKPQSIEKFLSLYAAVTRDDIRRNRGNIGERLAFLTRIGHGMHPHVWLKELRLRLGEHA